MKEKINELAEIIKKTGLPLSEAESEILADVLCMEGYEKKSEWISVEARHPEPHTRVLGYIKHLEEIHCYEISENRWWLDEDGWNTAKGFGITHWMPLPEPPEGE